MEEPRSTGTTLMWFGDVLERRQGYWGKLVCVKSLRVHRQNTLEEAHSCSVETSAIFHNTGAAAEGLVMPLSIAGKLVLITGASSGIGAACAEAFAAQSCNLILLARREQRLQELKEKLESEHKV